MAVDDPAEAEKERSREADDQRLRALLEREQYETDSSHDELQLAYRRGWNDRSRSLLAELVEVAR